MSAPAIVQLEIDQNADFQSDTYLWLDTEGNPVDLTGAAATLTIRTRPDPNAESILSITNGAGITLGGALGTVSFVFTASQTNEISQGEYFFTLRLSGVASEAFQLLSGTVLSRGSTV